MYLRLSFNALQLPATAFEILWYLINNPTVSTIAEITGSSFTGSTFSSLLNTTYCQLVRTASTENVQAHRTSFSNTFNSSTSITFRFKAYDTAQRYYFRVSVPSNGQNTIVVGDTYGIAWPASSSTAYGTSTTPPAVTNTITQWSGMTNTYYDYFFHITNKGLMWAAQGQTAGSVTGFPSTYNTLANYVGPFLCGQYTRYDLFNNESNSIFPVMATKNFVTTANPVYGMSSRHFTVLNNPFATSTEVGVQVLSALNMNNTANTTAIARTIAQNVHLGVGCRTTDSSGALNAVSNSVNVGVSIYGKAVTTTAAERYPSPDNSGYGFALLPITWSLSNFMMAGGNMSDQTGVYVFNGDYAAGDGFTYNSKTYVIWPLYDGFSNRIGIAVPKE